MLFYTSMLLEECLSRFIKWSTTILEETLIVAKLDSDKNYYST